MVLSLVLLLITTQARPPHSATSEASRVAGEYFVQKTGASWSYVGAKGAKAHYAINSFVEWRAAFSFSFGKKSASGHWRIKEGAWLERSSARSESEAVLLPATMSRGTTWSAPASIERGKNETSQYEVLALDAQVELPTGATVDHCLAVLESSVDGSDSYTHYYAPNVGKVAVRGPTDWLFRLTEFRSGHRGHAE